TSRVDVDPAQRHLGVETVEHAQPLSPDGGAEATTSTPTSAARRSMPRPVRAAGPGGRRRSAATNSERLAPSFVPGHHADHAPEPAAGHRALPPPAARRA